MIQKTCDLTAIAIMIGI